MSIESFHRSLHGAGDQEPPVVGLRAITKIEGSALIPDDAPNLGTHAMGIAAMNRR